MTLAIHSRLYSIHSFRPDAPIPAEVFSQPMFFIGKTRDELSIVVPEQVTLESLEQESHWRCLEILGPLGFSMTGILAKISTTLASANISIFAISTFDTDYILVKKDKLATAITALQKQNYQVIEHQQD